MQLELEICDGRSRPLYFKDLQRLGILVSVLAGLDVLRRGQWPPVEVLSLQVGCWQEVAPEPPVPCDGGDLCFNKACGLSGSQELLAAALTAAGLGDSCWHVGDLR